VAGNGCPFCSGRLAIPGETDLATLHPRLAAQWHPTKNGKLTTDQVRPGTHHRAWWSCDRGHEWRAEVKSRVAGSGCPMCARRTASPGENDIATLKPEFVAEWHPTRNGDRSPDRVALYSNKLVWWRCALGHEWRASPASRTKGGCPFCSGHRTLPGFNDLATLNPTLAAEWHPGLNETLTPQQVTPFSGRRVWWQCTKDHRWRTTIAHRSSGKGCPYCAFQLVWPGFNDLATTHPDLATEWHPNKNTPLIPESVLAGTHRSVWWRCSVEPDHEWRADIHSRSGQGVGCPACAKGGFNVMKDAWLYFLVSEDGDLLQIGITNVPKQRFGFHSSRGWSVIEARGPMDGHLTRQWERDILDTLRRRGALRPVEAGLERFDGHTESWVRASLPASSISELMEMVHDDQAHT